MEVCQYRKWISLKTINNSSLHEISAMFFLLNNKRGRLLLEGGRWYVDNNTISKNPVFKFKEFILQKYVDVSLMTSRIRLNQFQAVIQ